MHEEGKSATSFWKGIEVFSVSQKVLFLQLSTSDAHGQYTALKGIYYASNYMLRLTQVSNNTIANSWKKWIDPSWISHSSLV